MMKDDETWFGMGVKSGGILVALGYESVTGDLQNLKNLNDKHTFTIKSMRFGLGLGGGGTLTFILIFNAKNIYRVNGKTIDDWDFNVDIAKARLKDVKNLVKLKKSIDTLRLLTRVNGLIGKANDLREAMSFFYDAYGGAKSKEPSVHTLDVPFLGAGAEVSLFKTIGTLQIDFVENDTQSTKEHKFPTRGRNAP